MEDIFTNTQVPQHSLKRPLKGYLVVLFVLTTTSLFSQKLSTENKKSIKLYYKAEDALIDRDFRSAKDHFQEAIKKDSSFQEPYLKLASIYNIYQNKDSSLIYYSGYVRITPAEKVNWKIWKNLAYLNFEAGRYQEAHAAIGFVLDNKPEHINDPDLKLLKESIAFSLEAIKNPKTITITPLPDQVNAFQLQYFPILTVDEQTLIYTKRDSNRPDADEDIVFSKKTKGVWSPPNSISKEINTDLNEGACTISADSRLLIFTSCDEGRTFGSCDLFYAIKEGEEWSKPENMGAAVNSKYWDSQPTISADGRTLYFSSNRPGGQGKRDLWKTSVTERGWSEPENLGAEINGFRDETTPFIHANNNVLFFSSTSKPGLGGYDLFFCEKQNNIWGTPKNLGYPINSYQDEVSIFVAANGKDAFYSQEVFENGQILNSTIVQFAIASDSLNIHKSSYATGMVTNEKTSMPIKAELKLMNLNDSSDIYITSSDSITGNYFLTLTEGREYGVFVDKKGYLFENLSFKSKDNSILNPDTINIQLRPIEVGKTVILENIYFDFDQFQLNAKSIHELQRIVSYLKSNPEIKFEIEGHTDNQGNSDYNMILSQKRAQAVFDFLIKKSVDPNRLLVKGYGSSKMLRSDNSQESHLINRRIAFRVLK
ncbi:MAG: OOP family OmpA-OmpF porin [Cyclobacteriaceae bacterium]|jgi:OOP family OmpA-OmpF porin